MRSKTAARFGALLPIVLILAACSSSGKLELIQPKSGSIPSGSTVSLTIKTDQKENSLQMVQRLRSELFGRLVSEAIFEQVLHPRQKGDYALEVTVLKAESVSQGARIMLGVLAGSNKLRCSVRLVEQSTGRVATDFNVEGVSASHPLSSENGLDDAVREAVSNMIVALQ